MRWPVGYHKRHPEWEEQRCQYCGVTSDVRKLVNNHWPPKKQKYLYWQFKPYLVRSCLACDAHLGDSMQATLEERRKVAAGEDKEKYQINPVEPREFKL